MILYRPTGSKELSLIRNLGMRSFPPRLPEQPFFYPVTNEAYARQIAEWNVQSSGTGYVLRFVIDDAYAATFQKQVVGAREHEELWVPSGHLEEFNRHIVGEIEVVARLGSGVVPQHEGR